VVVRPAGPRNVGMIVRAATNFGPCELVLVAPQRPSLLVHPEFEQMAHGVPRAKQACRVVATLDEALAGSTHSVGFTARTQENRERDAWRTVRAELAARAAQADECVAFVFGAEQGGLVSTEVARLAQLVALPTSGEHTSVNLAIAVGIVLAELFQEAPHAPRERGRKAVSFEAREFLKANLKHVFADRVARTESARRDILESIERVFSRAPLEDRDARAWHLMLRALGSTLTPRELGLVVNQHDERHAALRSAALSKPRVLLVGAEELVDKARSLAAQRGWAVASSPSAEATARHAAFEPGLIACFGDETELAALRARFAQARVVAVRAQAEVAALLADVPRPDPGLNPGC